MEKVFFALAVVAMFSFVACNGNAAATDSQNADTNTTAVVNEPAPEENTTDSNAVQDMAEENNEAAQEEAAK